MTSLKETPCGDRNLGILAGDQSGLEMEVGVLLSVTVPRDCAGLALPYLLTFSLSLEETCCFSSLGMG